MDLHRDSIKRRAMLQAVAALPGTGQRKSVRDERRGTGVTRR